MSDIHYQLLDPVQLPLVNKFYKLHRVRGRAKRHDVVYVAKVNNEIVAAAKLVNVEQNYLLAGVYTAQNHRGQGIGLGLISTILDDTQVQKKTIYTFSYDDVISFYLALGFSLKSQLPHALAQLFEVYRSQGRKITVLQIN